MRVAALDLGTNTFLCLIADTENGEITRVIADETELVRLGQEINATGRIHPEALERADRALTRYAALIKQFKVDKVGAVATSAARDAKNKDDFFAITQKHQIPVQIISGDEEAKITFRGAIQGASRASVAVIDVGGGSTEIVVSQKMVAKDTVQLKGHSYQIGSVRLAEMMNLFPPFHPEKIQSSFGECRKIFSSVPMPQEDVNEIFAVAGTPTTLAAMDQGIAFTFEKVDNYVLSVQKLTSWIQKLARMSVQDMVANFYLEPKRADVLPAGAIVLAAAIEHLGHRHCIVSTRGVRYGLALKLAAIN